MYVKITKLVETLGLKYNKSRFNKPLSQATIELVLKTLGTSLISSPMSPPSWYYMHTAWLHKIGKVMPSMSNVA